MLEDLLNPINECRYTCNEIEIEISDTVSIYRGRNGSYRFVKIIDNQIISALQVMKKRGKCTVANVITSDKYLRNGFAKELFLNAKHYFKKPINHSKDLTKTGYLFSVNVN